MLPSPEIPQLIFYSNLKRNTAVFIRRHDPNANGHGGLLLSPLSHTQQHLHGREDHRAKGLGAASWDAWPGLLDTMLGWCRGY